MKGIILAGGSGTRLYPITKSVSKQLLPIYDKPMIYYPLSVLMLAGIKNILVITTPHDANNFQNLLGDGSLWGMELQYKIQSNPDGLAQAFIIAEEFIADDNVCLILGDNIFYGSGLVDILKRVSSFEKGATIFGYPVKNPERFGIIEFDSNRKVIGIKEKPKISKSNCAITGLYFCDNDVVGIAKKVKPSWRGELEITSIIETYFKKGNLKIEILGRGFAWLDTGTYDSLLSAGQYVRTIEERQGHKIACLEEIAYNNRWISQERVSEIAESFKRNKYGTYLKNLLKDA